MPLLFALLAACGGSGGSHSATTGGAAAVGPEEVAVSGHVTTLGTKGALLVFAFAGGDADPVAAQPLSLASLDADGAFAFTIPPVDGLTLAFLADGANDGAIDGGDPLALLTSPAFNGLRGGDLVVLDELALNFGARKASAASIDVRRSGEPASTRTPTPVPAG